MRILISFSSASEKEETSPEAVAPAIGVSFPSRRSIHSGSGRPCLMLDREF